MSLLDLDSSMPSGWSLNMSFLAELANKRIVVLGGGVTGSALVKFLIGRGTSVTLVDEKPSTVFLL